MPGLNKYGLSPDCHFIAWHYRDGRKELELYHIKRATNHLSVITRGSTAMSPEEARSLIEFLEEYAEPRQREDTE